MATTESRMKQLTGAYADLNKSNMLVGEMAVPTDHVPVVRNGVNSWEDLLTSQSAGDIIALSETMTEQIESFEQLVVDKVGVNDSTATLTQAYSGSKTQGLINGVNTNLALKANQTSLDAEITNRINAVANEKTERQAEILVERNRITNLATLAAGSTTGDAELIDIRTAANGIIYVNAGEAVRGQINSVSDDLNDLKSVVKYSENILNTASIQNGKYCSGFSANGTPNYGNSGDNNTFLFTAKKGSTYNTTNTRAVFCYMYDMVTKAITQFSQTDIQAKLSITPTNDSLVCITFYNAQLPNAMIIKNGALPAEFMTYGVKYDVVIVNSPYDEISNSVIYSENVLNMASIQSGKYCSGFTSNGTPNYGTSSDGNSTFLFTAKAGNEYNTTDVRAVFCYMYDTVTQAITQFSTSDGNKKLTFTPTNDSYVCLTLYDSVINETMIIENGVAPDVFMANGVKYAYGFKDERYPIIYCGAGREYTSFTEALKASTAYMGATLIVEDGTYNLYEELGGDAYFNSYTYAPNYYGGPVLKNKVKIYFSSKAKLTFNYAGSNSEVQKYFSPLNSGSYGFELHNLNLECGNCRYAIHDERNESTDLYRNVYENCTVTFNNTLNTVWAAKNCIGGGLGVNGEVIINGCYFNSVDATATNDTVSYHNSNNATAKSNILMESCYMAHGKLRFSSHGTSTNVTLVKVVGCSFENSISSGFESGGDNVTNINIVEWNNIIR